MQLIDNRYRLDGLLGTGGFGSVYRARHLGLDHDVAIKLLRADVDADAAKRLSREAKILARLDHPNCVRVMDVGSFDGAPYLVMELIEGQPLAALLGQPWTPARAVDVALALLAGLA
ncbi:MAG TPA: protein kinase, partial [Enhygromyxa sp.]|nr:protein kinase [Enhygromyxa sp.]